MHPTSCKELHLPKQEKRETRQLKETTKGPIEKSEELKASANISDEKKQEFEEINRRTKREIRRDIREHNTELIRRTIEHSKSTKKVARAISKGKQWMLGIKEATGKKLTSRENILTHGTDFYKTLYSSTPNNILQPQNYRSPSDDETEDIPPILQSEVRSTIAKTKNGKCPGEDGIHNNYLKMGSDLLIPPITNLFNQILETEEIPTEWKQSTSIFCTKKDQRMISTITDQSTRYQTFTNCSCRS